MFATGFFLSNLTKKCIFIEKMFGDISQKVKSYNCLKDSDWFPTHITHNKNSNLYMEGKYGQFWFHVALTLWTGFSILDVV